ncbi:MULTISPECIES: AraC family transcriptional regulator [Thalassolituus]|jgi:AraC-like DNA-binding protein|uniref:AraC family transcriptional regulator n=1 Tax=Thalassolituus TaxID=187492 RepID=UPI000838A880|nr:MULTISPECIES: AraC family transcriptional regulator [Thalassolituus]MDQ4422879.1 AraC family transcriptional regulator [Thalassolituus sp.]MDQ4425750.1 AraC family transcriptional regulator [Thalassolituus sp.]MEC7545386.1 AraC family transcriptional regulator [Pseudomonadota bacterium]MEC8103257.1 AraC family transcriptional regulator [Pseudomonadota bacterium]|tara:strand:- start:152 stop:1198 length:1047 start_codon:yes stop_codon:yes gene_type:complete
MSQLTITTKNMINRPVHTTLAAWPLAIIRALKAQDIDPAPLFEQVGLSVAQFKDNPDGRVDVRRMTQFWQLVEQATGNAAFGLEVAKYVQPMHFRALGLLMLTADNLEQAIQKLAQYHAMVSNSANIELHYTPEHIQFAIQPIPSVDISPLAIDSFLATLHQLALQLTSNPKLINKVTLQRSGEPYPERWQNGFGCAVEFKQTHNALWFDRQQVAKSDLMGDKKMAAYNESIVQSYVQDLTDKTVSQHVVHYIFSQLEKSEPTVTGAAQHLKLTERSLRRRLEEEGNQFRGLLQDCKVQLAKQYLKDTQLPITDIALRLGFADHSNFTRAFSKLTGQSPSAFRKKHLL